MHRTTRSRTVRIAKFIGLFSALALVVGAAPARAAEVAPQLQMLHVLLVSQSSDGETAFSCVLSAMAPDGSFSCGTNVTGRLVGVTNEFGAVAGHRVRITRRVSPTVVENYTGSIDYDVDGYGLWMAGEYSVTSQIRKCSGTGTLQRCVTYNLTSGPFPFTGTSILIGG